MNEKIIGDKIAIARKQKNLSQTQLANLLYMSPQNISKWECGSALPDVLTLAKIAEILNVDVSYFYSDENTTAKQTKPKEPQKNKTRGSFNFTNNWKGLDFSKSEFENINFKFAHFVACNFNNSNMLKLEFPYTDFFNCQMCEINFAETIWDKSDAKRTNFSKSNFINVNFKMADFIECDFMGCTWDKLLSNSTALKKCKFSNATISNCNFHADFIRNCNFENCILKNCLFENCKIKNTKFINCKMDKLTHNFLIISGAIIENAEIL